jgi:hypothetical protein
VLFRGLLIVAKSEYYFRHIRPSECIIAAPTARISTKFVVTGDFSVDKTLILLKSGRRIRRYTRPKYALKALCSSDMVSGCWDIGGATITPTCHVTYTFIASLFLLCNSLYK